MIEQFLIQGSSYAADIDNLITGIGLLVGFWGGLTALVFFWFCFRYRKSASPKSSYITGNEKDLKKFISVPHMMILVCDIFVIIFAVKVWMDVKQTIPPADQTIRIIGQQWAWTFVHPGPDGELDTADDIRTIDDLHVMANKTYHYQLEATDVIHDFSVPVFRLKQDAIPGRRITGWFHPTVEGEFDVQCAEMCGIGHGAMNARISVESEAAHQAWMGGALATGAVGPAAKRIVPKAPPKPAAAEPAAAEPAAAEPAAAEPAAAEPAAAEPAAAEPSKPDSAAKAPATTQDPVPKPADTAEQEKPNAAAKE
jgi:cytochrome c oxidase subunit II